VHGTR